MRSCTRKIPSPKPLIEDSTMPKLYFSAFADEYSPLLDEQLEFLKANGFSHIEPRGIDGVNISKLDNAATNLMCEKIKKSGIRVYSLGTPIGKIGLDENFASHMEMAKRLLELGARLEAKALRIFSFYLPAGKDRKDCRGEVIDRLGQLIALADSYGIRLCHENEAKIYGESEQDCLEILKAFDGKLGCVFDMGNFVLDHREPMTAYRTLREYIDYFHIKDALKTGAIVPPGEGEGCIADILSDFLAYKKRDTIITLEPHLTTFDGLSGLVDKVEFENPYVYPDAKTAFLDATERLHKITTDIGDCHAKESR